MDGCTKHMGWELWKNRIKSHIAFSVNREDSGQHCAKGNNLKTEDYRTH